MQKIDTIPNFFIVGAPKCGTTALSRYLGQHHNIFISTPKEPHFFASDFKNHRAIGSFEEYQKLFATCSREHLAVGEASVWYLYSQVAVRNIFDFNKQSKIIVMLRNPIDLVYSLHSQHIYAFYEDREQFQTAWELQEERSRGQKIPRMCRQPELLQYGKVGKLGEQLERVLEIFPRCQVKMILFDDFKAETKRVYVDVLSFLGVPDDQREDFPVINQNKAHRLMWLSQILQNRNNGPAFWLKYIEGVLKHKVPGGTRLQLTTRLLNMSIVTRSRPPLDPSLRKELAESFRSDIEKLSFIVDRDLSHWLVAKEATALHK